MKDQELIDLLKQQSKEIADANIAGYGNTMTEAANRLEQLVSLPSRTWNDNKEIKPINKGHYLVVLEDGRYAIFLWKKNKWWYDETQKEELLFGIRDNYVIKWMLKP